MTSGPPAPKRSCKRGSTLTPATSRPRTRSASLEAVIGSLTAFGELTDAKAKKLSAGLVRPSHAGRASPHSSLDALFALEQHERAYVTRAGFWGDGLPAACLGFSRGFRLAACVAADSAASSFGVAPALFTPYLGEWMQAAEMARQVKSRRSSLRSAAGPPSADRKRG